MDCHPGVSTTSLDAVKSCFGDVSQAETVLRLLLKWLERRHVLVCGELQQE